MLLFLDIDPVRKAETDYSNTDYGDYILSLKLDVALK
jgi:hypothetical protein